MKKILITSFLMTILTMSAAFAQGTGLDSDVKITLRLHKIYDQPHNINLYYSNQATIKREFDLNSGSAEHEKEKTAEFMHMFERPDFKNFRIAYRNLRAALRSDELKKHLASIPGIKGLDVSASLDRLDDYTDSIRLTISLTVKPSSQHNNLIRGYSNISLMLMEPSLGKDPKLTATKEKWIATIKAKIPVLLESVKIKNELLEKYHAKKGKELDKLIEDFSKIAEFTEGLNGKQAEKKADCDLPEKQKEQEAKKKETKNQRAKK